jgi:hypothetical protein
MLSLFRNQTVIEDQQKKYISNVQVPNLINY